VGVAVEEVYSVLVSCREEVAASYKQAVGASCEDDVLRVYSVGVDPAEAIVEAEAHLVCGDCFGAG